MKKFQRLALSIPVVFALLGATGAATDPDNPTCPVQPNWSANKIMELTVVEMQGKYGFAPLGEMHGQEMRQDWLSVKMAE